CLMWCCLVISCFFVSSSSFLAKFYTLSLHDALPISFMMNLFNEGRIGCFSPVTWLSRKEITVIRPLIYLTERDIKGAVNREGLRSEEHTSELQSRFDLVCRLLLEKKKKKHIDYTYNI